MIDSETEPMINHISEPSSPRQKEMLLNPRFKNRMGELTRAYQMRDQYDNCYHEGRKTMKKYEKMANKFVQTNVLELLGVDDLM